MVRMMIIRMVVLITPMMHDMESYQQMKHDETTAPKGDEKDAEKAENNKDDGATNLIAST